MIAAIISFFLVIWIFIFAIRILPRLFIYGVVLIFMAIQFAVKKISLAPPFLWIISAIYAVSYGLYALGRQILFNRFLPEENAKALIAEKLPHQYNLRKRSFSLLIIELMLVKYEFISDHEG